MLIGRDNELEELETLYGRTGFRAVGIYGRRGVGKTSLIQEFAREKKVVYFRGMDTFKKHNLLALSRSVYSLYPNEENANKPFKSYDEAFKYMRDTFRGNRVVVVIDNINNLFSSDKSFSSDLKKAIDNTLKQSNILLIVVTSLKNQLLGEITNPKSILYKRISKNIIIEPFGYMWSSVFMSGFTSEEKAILYGITGGIPAYLSLINNELSLKDNIINMFLKNDALLKDEAEIMLKSVVREQSYYNEIMDEVSEGAETLNDIVYASDLESATVATYMKPILSLELLRKISAVSEENNRKKTKYEPNDYPVIFSRRVTKAMSYEGRSDDYDEMYDRAIVPIINQHMKSVFADMAFEYIRQMNVRGELSLKLDSIGKWWDNTKNESKKGNLDIYCLSASDKKELCGSIRFSGEPLNVEDLFELMENAKLPAVYDSKEYVFFSNTGYAQDLKDVAASNSSITCITLEDMYSFL